MGHAISNLALRVGYVFFINHISKCSAPPPSPPILFDQSLSDLVPCVMVYSNSHLHLGAFIIITNLIVNCVTNRVTNKKSCCVVDHPFTFDFTCKDQTILRLHTSLNLTCLGCFMLPTTAYESNLGSQVARKFVNHRPTWLSCLSMEEGNLKKLQFIFYTFLYENRRPIICALLEKYCSIFSFVGKAVVEELENSAHSHRKWAVPFELSTGITRHMVNVVSQMVQW